MAAPALLTTILVTLAPAKPPPTADASTVALTWRAPPACVDEHGGRALLRAYLGDTPIVDRPITVDITRRADGVFESTIAMDTDPPFATRTIASPRCDTLTRATALIIAVALEPVALATTLDEPSDAADAAGSSRSSTPRSTTSVPAPPKTPPPPTTDAARAPLTGAPKGTRTWQVASGSRRAQRSRPLEHTLRVAGGAALLIVPGPSGALELVYALGSEPWRVEAAVRGVLPRTVRYDDAGSPGGRFGLISGGVRGCPTPSWGRVSFPLCFGLEGGAVLARGVDVIAPTSRVTGWLALVGGVAVRVRLHRAIALVIGVDTLFSLRRPAYHVDGRELLFESSVLGGRALIGIEWIVAPRQRTPSRRSAR